MKKQVIKGKKPRVNPRSQPMPSKKHKDKKRKQVKIERLKDEGINPFLR